MDLNAPLYPPRIAEDGSLLVHFVWQWVSAVLTGLDDGHSALTVYSSVFLDEESEHYRPIRDFLSSRCRRMDSVDGYEDPGLVGGRGYATIYAVYSDCPGPLAVHECGRSSR